MKVRLTLIAVNPYFRLILWERFGLNALNNTKYNTICKIFGVYFFEFKQTVLGLNAYFSEF